MEVVHLEVYVHLNLNGKNKKPVANNGYNSLRWNFMAEIPRK